MGVPTGKTEPCPSCRIKGRDKTGDNLVVYDDGSKHCFACGHDEQPSGRSRTVESEELEGMLEMTDVARLPAKELAKRGISEATAKLYGVRTEINPESGEDEAYYTPLYKNGALAGYQRKVAREQGKRQKTDVSRVGDTKGSDPFGSHLHARGGRMVIVTEGSEDCLAAYDMLVKQGKKYRVVSTLGTDGWKRMLGYFETFEKVVIAYDQDAAGKQAAGEFAQALSSGKAVIMRWNGPSDPNALMLHRQGADVFYSAIQKAEPYRPDGFVTGDEVWRRMENYVEPTVVLPFPDDWELLREKMGGMREAEISMWTAGSSIGKTSYIRKLKSHGLTACPDLRIGEVELEERGEKTWRGLMQLHMGMRWKEMTNTERRTAWEQTYGTKRIITLDHRSQFGRGQKLIGQFKYLHYHMGCKVIFLDHVTLAVNEFGDGQGNQAQDTMMNEFLEFVETTGVHLCLISHLRKTGTGGKSFEEGAVPSMDDLKGSGSLKQVSFDIIGVSRNMQEDNDYERNVSQLHVMKCRETGRTGRADRLYWDDDNQALVRAAPPPSEGDEGADRSGGKGGDDGQEF